MSVFSTDKLSFIFVDALTEVISKMAGISFDILSTEVDSGFDEITGVMSLNGANFGLIFISAEEASLRVICSYMTGIPGNEITKDDLEDAVCEIVNMTAGNAKLRTNNAEQIYEISPPFVISGENMSVNTKKRTNIISRVLGNGEISIKLKLIFFT